MTDIARRLTELGVTEEAVRRLLAQELPLEERLLAFVEGVLDNNQREAVEALRKLEQGWKDFYDRNVGAWDVDAHGPLTLSNYVRSVLDTQ